MGDFNMILRSCEKNNANINMAMMSKFRSFVDDHELKELYMHGHMYTWSNERDTPTLTKIDRILVSVDTSILHHAFISIFIALWDVITHYISILMAILSYFTRFTMKRGNPGSWNSG